MRKAIIQFTNKCNAQCRHCAYECGPKGETMNKKDIEKVLKHLPETIEYFVISGGEPLVAMDELRHMLSYIREQKLIPNARIHVETNGFWARDAESAYRVLKELHEFGVHGVALASMDKFHREAGINTENLEWNPSTPIYLALERLYKETGSTRDYPIEVEAKGAVHGVLPVGRARNLPEEEFAVRSVCDISLENEVTIDPRGIAYLCCWRTIPSIGSAIDRPVDELVREASKDKIMQALLEQGPEGAAKELGVYKETDEEIYRINPCVKCEEIFRGVK